MRRSGTVLLAVVWSIAAAPVAAGTVLISNGLDNRIDAGSSLPEDSVHVQNVGCDAGVEYPCPLPWGDPTRVRLLEGGLVGGSLRAFESSSVALNGGSVRAELVADDSSSLALSDGSVGGFLLARQSSSVTMSGGSVGRQLLAEDSADVTLAGGSVAGFLWAVESARVSMSGGALAGGLYAYTSSRITLTGGSVGRFVAAYDSASLTLVGSGFAVDGLEVGFGPIAARSGVLTGTLASGEPIDNEFCHMGGECFPGAPATGVITLVAANECEDGLDNDGDGRVDLADPGCLDAHDVSEREPTLPCDDAVDNDGDGLVDFPGDPGCLQPASSLENPACQDGRDNDADGRIDFDGGASAGLAPDLVTEPDPHCDRPWLDRVERPHACGLGFELSLLVVGLQLRYRRGRGGPLERLPGAGGLRAPRPGGG